MRFNGQGGYGGQSLTIERWYKLISLSHCRTNPNYATESFVCECDRVATTVIAEDEKNECTMIKNYQFNFINRQTEARSCYIRVIMCKPPR